MTDEAPIAFTVTPYHEEQPAALQAPRRTGHELIGAFVWLLAAAGIVLASFLSVQRVTFAGLTSDGGDGDSGSLSVFSRQVITLNGWGQVHISSPLGHSVSSGGSGPVYGVLFCGCAALLAGAAAWQLVPHWRTRWVSPFWPALVGALMVLGSAATLVSEYLSETARSSDHSIRYQAGAGVYLAAASGIAALLPPLYRHWAMVRALPGPPVPPVLPQPELPDTAAF